MTSAPSSDLSTAWPHAPIHKLTDNGAYFVTCGTYLKRHHFAGKYRLQVLHRGLLHCAQKYGWQLEAWAVFSNHYHFVGQSPKGEKTAESLRLMLRHLHTETASWVNKLDQAPGRQVWYNFRETQLTYHGAYFARLNYVNNNPVKHGLVPDPAMYPWCSAGWLEKICNLAQLNTLSSFKAERLKIYDEFTPSDDW